MPRRAHSRVRDALPRMCRHIGAQFVTKLLPMRQIIIELTAATLLTVGAIVSLAAEALAGDVMVVEPYARASATPSAKAGAVYFTIINHGQDADRLIGVTADISNAAQLHESVEQDGVASMRAVEAVELGGHSEVNLSPGGLHVMLFNLRKPLKEGSHFKVTLQFERNGAIVVDVPVGSVAADGAVHGEHNSENGN